MEILSLVDKLESYVNASAHLPGTRKVVLDSRQLMELVDQLRVAIPTDVRNSQDMLGQREAIINQALLDARRLKASAQEESQSQVQHSTIVQQAQGKAEELLADAKRRADAMVHDAQRKAHDTTEEAKHYHEDRLTEANKYATETLFRLEQQLASVLNAVRRGLDTLEESKRVEAA
jgi:F0F1-type ATP synthase membrane subunit b/b'